jgi:hypothetical protein
MPNGLQSVAKGIAINTHAALNKRRETQITGTRMELKSFGTFSRAMNEIKTALEMIQSFSP